MRKFFQAVFKVEIIIKRSALKYSCNKTLISAEIRKDISLIIIMNCEAWQQHSGKDKYENVQQWIFTLFINRKFYFACQIIHVNTQSGVGPVLVYNCCLRAIIFGRMEITIGYGHLYRVVLIQNSVHALWDTSGSLCTSETPWQQSGIIMREIFCDHFRPLYRHVHKYIRSPTFMLTLHFRGQIFFWLECIGTPRIFFWRGGGDGLGLTLGLYIIYVWFWNLSYENHAKYPSWYLVRLQEKLKVTQQISIGLHS